MSGDYQKAITFGATHIRVGTRIFGERPKNWLNITKFLKYIYE